MVNSNSSVPSQFVGNKIICCKCGKDGHKTSDCRRTASNFLVDEKAINNEGHMMIQMKKEGF